MLQAESWHPLKRSSATAAVHGGFSTSHILITFADWTGHGSATCDVVAMFR